VPEKYYRLAVSTSVKEHSDKGDCQLLVALILTELRNSLTEINPSKSGNFCPQNSVDPEVCKKINDVGYRQQRDALIIYEGPDMPTELRSGEKDSF
jgi:hypothetical protein